MSKQHSAIKREMTMLSRYIGYFASRILTAILSLFTILRLSPSCVYIALMACLLPIVLQMVITESKKKEPEWQLPHTMKKYHFSNIRYQCERITAPILLLFIATWQYALTRGEMVLPWGVFPALLFVTNIASRIIVTICFRIHLHHEFTDMKQLD